MELKDVIHFYLGCECEYEGVLNGREMAEELKANKHDVFYIPKIQEHKGLKRGFLKLIEKYQNGRTIYRIGNKGLKAFYSTEGFKPLLRPLSNMTATESETKDNICSGIMDVYKAAALVQYLCKQAFDLFGLIESSQAIATSKNK